MVAAHLDAGPTGPPSARLREAAQSAPGLAARKSEHFDDAKLGYFWATFPVSLAAFRHKVLATLPLPPSAALHTAAHTVGAGVESVQRQLVPIMQQSADLNW